MKTINLKDIYPFYNDNEILEVSDEIAQIFDNYEKHERTYTRTKRRNKANYSLNLDDGIEQYIIIQSKDPYEFYEHQLIKECLYGELKKLPLKQASRIYAHIVLGISKTEIARIEKVSKVSVGESIERGLNTLRKKLKNIF